MFVFAGKAGFSPIGNSGPPGSAASKAIEMAFARRDCHLRAHWIPGTFLASDHL